MELASGVVTGVGPEVGVQAGVGAEAGADSRASHWAPCHNAEVVAGAAGDGGVGGGEGGGAAVSVGEGTAVGTAAGGAVRVQFQGAPDSGRPHTHHESYTPSAAALGYPCSNIEPLVESR